MTNSNRTASNSDARKRKAEKVDDPEYAEKFVDRVNEVMYPRDAERASELLDRVSGRLKETLGGHLPDEVREALSILGLHLTPPPVPAAPWESISEDRKKPTLAKVTWGDGVREGKTTTALYYRNDRGIYDEWGDGIGRLDSIESVEVLHTHNPETHVPVERALIARLLNLPGGSDSLQFRDELASVRACFAALADGAESKGADQ